MERIAKAKKMLVVAMLAVMAASVAGCHHFFNRHFGDHHDYTDR